MSNQKRKDSKGRNLRPGEFQEANGRYRFTYYEEGKQKCFYSWKLEDFDSLPKGKRPCVSLRSQIKEYNGAKDLGLEFRGKGMLVLDLVKRFIRIQENNPKIRRSTKKGYTTSYSHIEKKSFSRKRIDLIKHSDAVEFIEEMHADGLGYSTVSHIYSLLKSAFEQAVHDRLVWYNPFSFSLSDYIEDSSKKREAFNEDEKNTIIKLISEDAYYSRYVDSIEFLFETGLRISEFCGLTTEDIDFENGLINVRKQLHKDKDGYLIGPPKTKAGIREIPLTDKAVKCLEGILSERTKRQEKVVINGYSGFLTFGRDNKPRYGAQWAKIFEHIWDKYSERKEFRHDLKFTPHICRHTYATLMSMKGMSPEILTTLMGHADTGITYKKYIHVNSGYIAEELTRLGVRKAS